MLEKKSVITSMMMKIPSFMMMSSSRSICSTSNKWEQTLPTASVMTNGGKRDNTTVDVLDECAQLVDESIIHVRDASSPDASPLLTTTTTTTTTTMESILMRDLNIRFIDARNLLLEARLKLGIKGYPSKDRREQVVQTAKEMYENELHDDTKTIMYDMNKAFEIAKREQQKTNRSSSSSTSFGIAGQYTNMVDWDNISISSDSQSELESLSVAISSLSFSSSLQPPSLSETTTTTTTTSRKSAKGTTNPASRSSFSLFSPTRKKKK